MTYFWINETIGLEAIIRKNTYVYKWSKSICYLGYQLKQLHFGWKNTPLYSIQWQNVKLTYSIILMYSILMVFLRKMTKISWTIPVSNQYIWPLFSLSSLFTKLFIRIHNQPIQISFKFHRIHPQHICELHQVIFFFYTVFLQGSIYDSLLIRNDWSGKHLSSFYHWLICWTLLETFSTNFINFREVSHNSDESSRAL